MSDLQQAMLDEIRAALEVNIPEHAMGMEELCAELDADRKRVRNWIRDQLAANKWRRARRGNKVYYWKVEED